MDEGDILLQKLNKLLKNWMYNIWDHYVVRPHENHRWKEAVAQVTKMLVCGLDIQRTLIAFIIIFVQNDSNSKHKEDKFLKCFYRQ